jgi:hypothetical protein
MGFIHQPVTRTCFDAHKPFNLERVMSFLKPIALAALFTMSLAAQATSVPLADNGQWQAFGVDSQASLSGGTEWIDNDDTNATGYGTPLTFSFTIAAGWKGQLTVVDAVLAGDVFNVFNNGALLGATSSVPVQQYSTAPDTGFDYDAALQDSRFSRGVYTLGAGHYNISGVLAQSLMFDGADPLNATAGAIKLSVSAVPEPTSIELLLASLGLALLISSRVASR